jgi:CRISPR-associated endonuclease/helicase Cas3
MSADQQSAGARASFGNELVPQTAVGLLREALDLPSEQEPFPWQVELLRRFLQGTVERALDLPTGLGKTAVMAIWLVARALGARLPMRLVYVVDRRAVVDQATETAMTLRAWVARHPEVSAALGLGEGRALPISTLRGQFVDNREWAEDPSTAAIIVGTVDMIGSRLLFEGYATSRKVRPFHTALLANDTLVVLDEAHLVPPFEQLVEVIARREGELGPEFEELRALIPGMRVLSLSATGRRTAPPPFRLTEADAEHPVERQRLQASKSLRFEELGENEKLAEVLAEEAWALSGEGQLPVRCLVYANKRDDAEKARAALEKLDAKARGRGEKPVETELFVGARRVHERTQAAKALRGLGFLAKSKEPRTRPAFLFATSAAEVGVDLDADHMVCDLVAWERMVQRFGRVNRRGAGDATIVVLGDPSPEVRKALGSDDRSAEASAYVASRDLIRSLRPHGEGTFDASPDALVELRARADADPRLGRLVEQATSPAPLRPALTRPLLDAWAMTSLRQHTGRPEVAPWLRGWITDEPQTTVVWRRFLAAPTTRSPSPAELERFFEAAPPHAIERLETTTYRVVDWLIARAATLFGVIDRRQGAAQSTDLWPLRDSLVGVTLDQAGEGAALWRLQELHQPNDRNHKTQLNRRLAGKTLVLDARMGGLTLGLLDASSDTLPPTLDGETEWLGSDGGGPPGVPYRIRLRDTADAVEDRSWRERYRSAWQQAADGEVTTWLVVEKYRVDAATEDDRATSNPQRLEDHAREAVGCARHLAERLSLPTEYGRMLEAAARLHDEGKRAPRWQKAFKAPADGPWAKTRGPVNVRLLDGYRHEFGSLATAERDPELARLPAELRELALHLIAAHHGFARPVIRTTGCEDAPPSALERRARAVALRYARLQKRWGPWGLAWWEALLRAADQRASRDNDIRDPAPAGSARHEGGAP